MSMVAFMGHATKSNAALMVCFNSLTPGAKGHAGLPAEEFPQRVWMLEPAKVVAQKTSQCKATLTFGVVEVA